jgi:pyruvate ferredoxin oxidoreductase beta subunit
MPPRCLNWRFSASHPAANEYDGPAVVGVYTTCQPEHGVGDNMAMQQSKLAVDTRTFPVLIYDPRKGDKIAQPLSLQGNPSEKQDFFIEPKTNEVYDFIHFARTLPIGINTLDKLRHAPSAMVVNHLPGNSGCIIPRGEAASPIVSRVLTNAATDKDGNPSETLLKAKQERLDNWLTLQELAGIT